MAEFRKLGWDRKWRLRLSEIPDEKLGALLKEYLDESEHGSWEGFNARDVRGIYRMLRDMELYFRYSQE